MYHFVVLQTPHGTGDRRLTLDGHDQAGMAIPLVDDQREHTVEMWVRAVMRSMIS